MDHNLLSIVDQFSNLKVMVIGEAILESYVKGDANRLSLEAPAPVVAAHEDQIVPGGAANTAAHARSLGAEVTFLSVVGKDMEGEALLQQLRARGVLVSDVLRLPDRRTLLRRRVYAGGQLIVRYDQGSKELINHQTEELLLEEFRRLCAEMDVVVLSDYAAGLFTPYLLDKLGKFQENQPCFIIADTRRIDDFKPLDLAAIKLSYYSVLEQVNGGRDNGSANGTEKLQKLSQAGEEIIKRLNTRMAAITMDDDGALLFERKQESLDQDTPVYRTYARSVPFNRVDGAGDAFTAGFALALAAGADGPAAAEIASAVGSLVVRSGGMGSCCAEDVRAALSGDEKIYQDRFSLADRIEQLKQQGKKVVFTNGCFDILHSGHVSYLNQAKSFGDVLVVAVNTDESVRRLKGEDRPINSQEERLKVLAGLSCVDLLVPFGENTPVDLIEMVKPNVYVKGGDYTRETLPETPVVERLGGEIRIVPYVEDHSTSRIINKIKVSSQSV